MSPYSIFKSFVTRSLAEDSAIARRGEGDNVTDDLELELRGEDAFQTVHFSTKRSSRDYINMKQAQIKLSLAKSARFLDSWEAAGFNHLILNKYLRVCLGNFTAFNTFKVGLYFESISISAA